MSCPGSGPNSLRTQYVITDYTIEGRKAAGLWRTPTPWRFTGAENCRRGFHCLLGRGCQDDRRREAHSQCDFQGQRTLEVGKVFGLGVMSFLGSTLEIEAVHGAREGKGHHRMNETAGTMVKTLCLTPLSSRKKFSIDLSGGRAREHRRRRELTDRLPGRHHPGHILCGDRQPYGRTWRHREISLGGKSRPSAVYEKIYGAKQAGMKAVLIPKENGGGVKRYAAFR